MASPQWLVPKCVVFTEVVYEQMSSFGLFSLTGFVQALAAAFHCSQQQEKKSQGSGPNSHQEEKEVAIEDSACSSVNITLLLLVTLEEHAVAI